jgi:intracellular sulfur oxidation DsrE/DsrF family protein
MGATLLSLAVLSGAAGAEPELVYPRIKGYGGVVPLPKAAEQPRKGAKVVFDITADAKADEVNKGLVRAARLLNLYAAAGLADGDVAVALVLHGEATRAALADKPYAARFGGKGNPNLPLLRDLKKAGAEVYVCGQALHEKKFPAEEVADEATVALAALTAVVNKQADGYACLPVP